MAASIPLKWHRYIPGTKSRFIRYPIRISRNSTRPRLPVKYQMTARRWRTSLVIRCGMAYPFGDYDEKVIAVLRELNLAYCRTTKTTDPCFPPPERLAWGSTAHQLATNPSSLDRWKTFYANPKSSGVFAIWGHSWEFSRTAGWNMLEQIFRPMSGHADVWYCTNIELFDWFDAQPQGKAR